MAPEFRPSSRNGNPAGQSVWQVRPRNPERENALAQALSIHPLTAHLLLSRGIEAPDEARRFLSPEWGDLPGLSLLPDMDQAITRLIQAIERKEQLLLFGDYDVDGMTGTAQLALFLGEVGLPVQTWLPHRIQDGYGLKRNILERILTERSPQLLITIDNGTNAMEELRFLHERGIDVIVIDHHETPKERPPVVALLNPKRKDSTTGRAPFPTYFASAGLVYLILIALRSELRRRGVSPLPNLRRYLDLACLGTLADIVPLTGLNRLIVREGLRELAQTTRPGLKALKERAEVTEPVSVGQVNFRLAPRLNAAGRLAHPDIALKLLMTGNPHEASDLATRLEGLNRERQEVEARTVEEACQQVEGGLGPGGLIPRGSGIVVSDTGWHLGVAGIVASKLVERYRQPSVVIAIEGEIGRGSARSVPGLSLYEVFCEMRDLFLSFGGHAMAAGLTIESQKIKPFREKFQEAVSRRLSQAAPPRFLDAVVSFSEITLPFLRELLLLEPHGPGNPEPTFLAKQVSFSRPRIVGRGHLKAVLHQNGQKLEAIGFDLGHLPVKEGGVYPIIFRPTRSNWQGIDAVQLILKEIPI